MKFKSKYYYIIKLWSTLHEGFNAFNMVTYTLGIFLFSILRIIDLIVKSYRLKIKEKTTF